MHSHVGCCPLCIHPSLILMSLLLGRKSEFISNYIIVKINLSTRMQDYVLITIHIKIEHGLMLIPAFSLSLSGHCIFSIAIILKLHFLVWGEPPKYTIIYKKLCIYSYMFKLQSPSIYSPFNIPTEFFPLL